MIHQINHVDSYIITIIIPAYNAEKYIERTIEKVNEMRHSVEIIVVDDGSKDNTLQVCNVLKTKYSNLYVYTQFNAGVSAARNLGIEHAHGKWVFFCDSDDWIDAENLSVIVDRAEMSDGKTLFLAAMNFVKPAPAGVVLHPVPNERAFTIKEYLSSILFQGSSCNYLFPLQIIRENGIRFPVGVVNTEDQVFNIKCICCSNGVYSINTPIYNYNHLNESSASHTNRTIKWRLGPLYGAIDLLAFCVEKGVDIKIVAPQIDRLVEYYYRSHIYGNHTSDDLANIRVLLDTIAKQCSRVGNSIKYKAVRLNPCVGLQLLKLYNWIKFR